MARTHVFRSLLAASGMLFVAACATQPTTPLLERKFQQTAASYEKFQHEGQVVYCKKGTVPQCITEAALRRQVEDYERDRNTVGYWRAPPAS
jgi:hypothetical protein